MVIYTDSPNNRAIAIPRNDVEIPLNNMEKKTIFGNWKFMTKLSSQLSSTV
ncbi:hypothetical protein [Cylindrospermopsis curvispora]|uniref:Uncharacterized protein n=1 Tax=Cylindrospermopsis curvispora GIHE-G1 TaxID=2666332 RepID=A0A7H0F495_9CYAN|nr:hypothetical protein [Cylindrospermopsis curvispora]QNP30861.1 hypothetical protein IAR63_07730 [Cylindrospermopsis curvispora GIHE-G1]